MDDLRDLRIVITRPRSQAEGFAGRLRKRGASVIYFPVIRIAPLEDTTELDAALQQIESYDWLIMTSVNGVEAVWERFSALGISPVLEGVQVAAIGPKTAAALERRGVTPGFVPDEYVAEAILPGLGELNRQRFLLTRADLARPALATSIRDAGGVVDDLNAYRTVPELPDREALGEIMVGVDCVTFTSSSTVDNFVRLIRQESLDPHSLPGDPVIACIGPITAATAEEAGLRVGIVPDSYTTGALVEAIAAFNLSMEVDVI
jgi:uroporphyrinogen III methyltransferase/synthase